MLIARQRNKRLAHCAIQAYSACCRSFGLSIELSWPATLIHTNCMYNSEQAKPTHCLKNCTEFPFSQHQHIDGHNFYYNKYQSLEKHTFLYKLFVTNIQSVLPSQQTPIPCKHLVYLLCMLPATPLHYLQYNSLYLCTTAITCCLVVATVMDLLFVLRFRGSSTRGQGGSHSPNNETYRS